MDKKLIMLKNLFQVIINNLDILLVLISLVTKVYLMPHLIGLYLTPKVFVLNIGLLLLLTSGAYILKFRRTFLLLVNTACSLMFLADILNYRYFSIPLTSYAFLQTPNLSGLSSSIFALFRWSDLILFADFLFLPLLFFPIKRNPKQGKVFLISQLILGLALTCAYPVSQLYAEQSELFRRFDTGQEFHKFGPLGFHVVDTAYYIKDQNIKLDTEKEDMILDWFTRREQRVLKESPSELESIAKGMNLIVIQVESLQNFVIGKSVGGQAITPNLNKLLKNSLYFPHFYPQTVDGNSSDAELAVNTSLYPIKEGSTFFRFPGNQYNSLPLLLKSKGYNTLAIHADKASFWNRYAVYPHLGFNEFWDISKFSSEDQIGMGVGDITMFEESASMLGELPQPFYSFLITLTSHYPYYIPDTYQYLRLPDNLQGTHLGNYLQAVRYTDEAIGKFFTALQKDHLLDNSLVVIYGDHDGLFERDKPELERLWTNQPIDMDEWIREYVPVPLLIYKPGLKGKTIDIYGGQVDVLPTLSCLLGLDQEETKYAMGKNLLAANKGFAILPRGDYIKQAALVTPDTIQTDLDDRVQMTLHIADLIIKTNFFQ